MTDPRDALLQRHAPLVLVPRYGPFSPLDTHGHRYLAAGDGLWLELRRPWVYLRQPIAASEIPLPYGPVGAVLRFEWERWELERLIDKFILAAERALPNECAAWGVWSATSERLEYLHLDPTDATPGSVTFERPPLSPHEHLAVDLHSHGALPAGFSSVDDADDAGEVKLAVVIGELGAREPSLATRMCALGLFLEAA